MNIIKSLVEKYKNLDIVLKATIWFIAVTVVDKGIAVLTQPVVNRILSIDQVGICGLYNSWYSILAIFETFNLSGGVLEVYLTKGNNKSQVIASLSSLSFIISLIFFGLIFLFIDPISAFLDLKPIYLFVMALTIISETFVQFWAVPKRFEYAYKSYAILTVAVFFTKCCLSIFLAYFYEKDRVLGRIVGLCVPSLILAVFLVINIISNCDFRKISEYWGKAIKFCLPLIPHYLASVLLASSDRVMIEKMSGINAVGLYTVAYSYANLAIIIFSAINNAYNPYSMRALKDENYSGLSKMTNSMLVISILFSALMIYLAPEGLMILGGKQYIPALRIIPVLVVGIFFSSFYFIFSNVEFVYEKTGFIFPITVGGTLLNVGLNYLLIPKFGYEVAAYTTLLGYVLIAIAHYFVSRTLVGRDIFNIKAISLMLVVLTMLAVLGYYLYNVHPLIRYFIVVVIAMCCFGSVVSKRWGLKKKD